MHPRNESRPLSHPCPHGVLRLVVPISGRNLSELPLFRAFPCWIRANDQRILPPPRRSGGFPATIDASGATDQAKRRVSGRPGRPRPPIHSAAVLRAHASVDLAFGRDLGLSSRRNCKNSELHGFLWLRRLPRSEDLPLPTYVEELLLCKLLSLAPVSPTPAHRWTTPEILVRQDGGE